MDQGTLKQRVLARDWEVIDEAKRRGPSAIPEIGSVLGDPDPRVRELAVTAIKEIGGPEAASLCAAAAKDPSPGVRYMALTCLDESATAAQKDPLEALVSSSPDEVVRSRVALVLGRIGDARTADLLRARVPVEADRDAARSLQLALAKLGDPVRRDEALAELGAADASARYAALKKIAYLHDPRLLRRLIPLLDDAAEVQNLAPSHAPRQMMRIKDAAVNVTAEVSGHRFSFDATRKQIFSDAQIAEARAFLGALPP